jgi:basic amino acid/polyamine antiporter, APA family
LPVLVNIRGVRWGGGLQLAITMVKVGSLLAIMLLPWVFMALGRLPQMPEPTEAVVPHGVTFSNFLTALLGVLFAYHGWMNLAPVAGEIRNPQRNIPIALIGGVVLVVVLYLGANVAYYQVLPSWEIPNIKGTPVANVFSVALLGSAGGIAMSLAIMFSTFGALNGNLLTCPRLLYAMGEDGLAPRALGAVHPRFHTPALAIVVMGVWSILLVVGVAVLARLELIDPDKNQFDRLTDFAMFGAVIFETMAISTIFVFRRFLPDAPRAYRCWGYPIVPALYMIFPVLVLGNMFMYQQLEAFVGAGFILVGACVYLAVARRSTPRA